MGTPDSLVSIIIPVHNAENYIEETVSSVIQQTFKAWELILVDDCSTDGSRQKIEDIIQKEQKRYPEENSEQGICAGRIRLIAKTRNEGAARARNTGMDAAKGRYIAFLDSDDIWLADKLQKEMDFMREKQAAFVFSSYEFGDECGKPTGRIVHVPESLTYRKALSRTVIFTSTVLLDTEKTGRELIHMPAVASEDSATWWKILRSGIEAYGLDEVLVIYRRPVRSLSSNKLEAVRRIWNLYRREEHLSLPDSCVNLFFWAVRATGRRL